MSEEQSPEQSELPRRPRPIGEERSPEPSELPRRPRPIGAPRGAERILIALASGAAAAIFAYAALRGVERAFFAEPNPALLIWSDSSAFLWRAQQALYAGGLGAFGGYALAGRAARARWLGVAIAVAVGALLIEALVAP